MCGVFAALAARGTIRPEQVRAATDRLAHRGPDGEGMWIRGDGRVALGHRRLSIIGLDDGTQPLANEDESLHVTVNGEFYGFESLRRNLENRGHCFRTQSDSEIVLHLYEEYGTGCLEHLRGEFAFVLWDERRKRLFAARDRFGVKPLLFAQDEERLWLASEAKALFAAGLRAAWDRESFFHVSALQYVLPDRTLFQGVRQLRPGHYLLADAGGISIHSYWDLDYPREDAAAVPGFSDARELVERCRILLLDAVGARLRADVPLCCHLSGGLDSSAVLGLATHLASRPLDAFTISFAADPYDELPHAQAAASASGARLHVVRVSQDDVLEHLDAAVRGSEGLAINGHLPAKYLLHQAIREAGFKVVLTGEGADEVFLGYAHQRLDLWRERGNETLVPQMLAANETSLGMMLPEGAALDLERVRERLGFVPAYLQAKACLGWRVQRLLRAEALTPFAGRDPFVELLEASGALGQIAGRRPVDGATWLWTKTALANYILHTLGDGTEMPASVEGRVPFLDHLLFGLLRNVPPELKVAGGTEKHLLREAARPYISDAVYKRQKHPFDAPPLSLFATARGRSHIENRIRSPAFERQPFFCRARCVELLAALPGMTRRERQAWDPALMTVLTTIAMQDWLDDEAGGNAK